MNEQNNTPQNQTPTAEKPGFFKRMVNKLDNAMKEKADEDAKQSSCCGPDSDDKGKGEKCC